MHRCIDVAGFINYVVLQRHIDVTFLCICNVTAAKQQPNYDDCRNVVYPLGFLDNDIGNLDSLRQLGRGGKIIMLSYLVS